MPLHSHHMEHTDTLSQIALILAIAFAGEVVLRRLRQPALVGYILAGIIMGPSVLGVIHNGEQVSFLAELGIMLLLFIVGLELDLAKFAKISRIAVITTAFQIIASLCVVGGIGWMLDWPLARILVLGFAISLSSTAVAIRVLEGMGGINTRRGQAAVGILVAQDLAFIPMLLLIGAFSAKGFDPWGLVKVGLAVVFLIFAMRVLSRRSAADLIPSWIKAQFKGGNDQTLVLKALTVCFAGAALSGILGLSASYGAFVAGLLIGSTPHSHKYEDRARPLFDILMMVFFLSVGLLIDLRYLVDNWGSILLMLLVVMILKTFVNIAVLRRMGMSRRHALHVGTALAQIGEFSFVLAALGLSTGAIQDDGHKFVVTLIALSLIFTPVWLHAARRTILLRRWWRHRHLNKKAT